MKVSCRSVLRRPHVARALWRAYELRSDVDERAPWRRCKLALSFGTGRQLRANGGRVVQSNMACRVRESRDVGFWQPQCAAYGYYAHLDRLGGDRAYMRGALWAESPDECGRLDHRESRTGSLCPARRQCPRI